MKAFANRVRRLREATYEGFTYNGYLWRVSRVLTVEVPARQQGYIKCPEIAGADVAQHRIDSLVLRRALHPGFVTPRSAANGNNCRASHREDAWNGLYPVEQHFLIRVLLHGCRICAGKGQIGHQNAGLPESRSYVSQIL
jgi:hypothetical protein